jgi:hypothetical protein
MQTGRTVYLDGIYALPHLFDLSIEYPNDLDFSSLSDLRRLATTWSPRINAGLLRAVGLERLLVRRFKTPSGALNELEMLTELRELEIVQSPITSLRGVERFPKIKHLRLYYCSKLRDISALEAIASHLELLTE